MTESFAESITLFLNRIPNLIHYELPADALNLASLFLPTANPLKPKFVIHTE
jgi:hypothetical protein